MKISLWMSLLLLVTTGAQAQDTLKLNLNQSLEIALSENPTIKIADREIQLQKYVKRETVGNLLPTISAGGSYSRSVIKSTMDAGGGKKFSFEPTNTVAGVASLSLPLFAPAVYRTLKLNEEQMRGAVEAARASRITLMSEVKKAYYNTLLGEQSLAVLKVSEANIQQTVDQTRDRYTNGLASEYDLLTAEVQLSNLRPTILQTENAIRVSKQLFKMYLYLPQEVEVELVGTLDDFQQAVLTNSGAMSSDISLNSDLKQLDIQREILIRQYKVARTSRMPTLAAVSNFQVMGRNKISFTDLAGGSGGAPKERFELQTPMSIGLQLSVPIFAGLTKASREKQIQQSIEKVKLQREYTEQTIGVQVKTSINNLLTAQSQMQANRVTIGQASKGYSIANTRYTSGVGTILELNTAELSLTQAKLNYSQSIYDYLSAEAEYQKIIGSEATGNTQQ